ncbi:MAG: hypothetical protein ACWIPH_05535 [Ostreibacterium sp.]
MRVFSFLSIKMDWVYRRPIIAMIVLALLSNLYLIADSGVVNRSSILLLWKLANLPTTDVSGFGILGQMVFWCAHLLGISVITAGHLLMVFCFMGISLLLLLIARYLEFSLMSQWALIFLVLSNVSFNDFRGYIIIEPIFWLLWLLAIYLLLVLHKKWTIVSIGLWLCLFLLATRFSVVAWFWLLLFPFGALFWRPWRRKSVAYALIGYAIIVSLLLILPVYQGISPIQWFRETILTHPETLLNALSLSNNNWLPEGDYMMSGVFIFSGATSLVAVRTLISLGVIPLLLVIYSVMRQQYKVVNPDYFRILIYVLGFDIFISVIMLILAADRASILSFSSCFLLLLFATLGLSYIFKKIQQQQYSRLTVLIIVWSMVAYFASGFIIFGPQKTHIKVAAQAFATEPHGSDPVYSNDGYFLFYQNKKPSSLLSVSMAERLSKSQSFYYGYSKNRNRDLPVFWQEQTPIATFANRHGDQLLIYHLP